MKNLCRKNIIAFAAVAAVVSCTEEMQNPGYSSGVRNQSPIAEGRTTVSAGLVPTKTFMDAGCRLFWAEDDAIQINGVNSTAITIDSGNAAAADFTIGGVVNYPYCGVSPASAATAFDSRTCTATIALPESRNYVEGTFDPSATVLLSYAEKGGMSFSCAMSVLKITISGGDDADAIKSVRINANDGTAMSGEFSASFGRGGCTLLSNAKDYSRIMLTADAPVAQNTPIYVAIPAQTYPEGISFFMIDENDDWCQVTSRKSFTAEPGAVYPAAVQFNANGKYQGPGIYTAEDWMRFASKADLGDVVSDQCPAQSSGNGDFSEFQDAEGVVNMWADINVPTIDWSAASPDQRQGSITNWSSVFDGHNHTLSADLWKIPVFQFIFANGVVRNLKVDTSNFSPRSYSAWGGCCLLASVLNGGEINNCVNNASISINSTSGTSVSGICRTVYSGRLVNCTNNGNLLISQAGGTSCNVYMGGICSIIGKSLTSYELGGNVEITGCTNNGSVSLEQTVYENPQCYVAVGGIAGWLVGGSGTGSHATIRDCENNGAVMHRTPAASGASNTSSSVGGLVGVAFVPNKAVGGVPQGRMLGYMFGGKALNTSDTTPVEGFYFVIDNCVNRGNVTNANHIHGTIASGTIRNTVIAGGLIGSAIGQNEHHAVLRNCRNYGTVVSGNTATAVPRSFCNTVLGGLIGFSGCIDLDSCVFKGQLGAENLETYCTGGLFGGVLSNCSAAGCKVYVDRLVYTNTQKSSFHYYGLLAGTISTWGRDADALTKYCSACSFTGNACGGHITATVYSTNSDYAADTDIDAGNISGYLFNAKDAANATVAAYTVSGNTIWNGEE